MLGSALDLRRSQIRTYERVMREHGDVVRLVVGPPGVRFDLYCVLHPEGITLRPKGAVPIRPAAR